MGGRDEVLGRPLQDPGVGGAGGGGVVFGGDVEGEVDEGLAAGMDERGESVVCPSDKQAGGFFVVVCGPMQQQNGLRSDICSVLGTVEMAIEVPLSIRYLA